MRSGSGKKIKLNKINNSNNALEVPGNVQINQVEFEQSKFDALELIKEGKGFSFEMEGERTNLKMYVVCYNHLYRRTTKPNDKKINDYTKRLLWVSSGGTVSEQVSLEEVRRNLALTEYTDKEGNIKLVCKKKDMATRTIAISDRDREDVLSEIGQPKIKLKRASQSNSFTYSSNVNPTIFSNQGGVMSIPPSTAVVRSERQLFTHEIIGPENGPPILSVNNTTEFYETNRETNLVDDESSQTSQTPKRKRFNEKI